MFITPKRRTLRAHAHTKGHLFVVFHEPNQTVTNQGHFYSRLGEVGWVAPRIDKVVRGLGRVVRTRGQVVGMPQQGSTGLPPAPPEAWGRAGAGQGVAYRFIGGMPAPRPRKISDKNTVSQPTPTAAS